MNITYDIAKIVTNDHKNELEHERKIERYIREIDRVLTRQE